METFAVKIFGTGLGPDWADPTIALIAIWTSGARISGRPAFDNFLLPYSFGIRRVASMARSGFDKRFPKRDEASATLLATNVLHLRKAKGWSQGELADAVGVKQQAISLIETARANPTLQMLDAIAGVFGVQMIALFDPMAHSEGASRSKQRNQI
jgi:DNA-binding XRE family transcriptional regulator